MNIMSREYPQYLENAMSALSALSALSAGIKYCQASGGISGFYIKPKLKP